ncbi:hypothetical protein [Pseudactinotalea sp. Z1748]|uniref:hypothetical protein n=1 Tax=Pseudactinotalea sp. Z1748 TaxID=3413027 RepID=UPI003C7D52D8
MNTTQRHPGVERLTGMLARILHGRAAQVGREELKAAPTGATLSLFVLPEWGWAISRIDVGRKDRIPGSTDRLLLPVRLTWRPGSVVVANQVTKAHFTAAGMGHNNTGTIHLDPGAEEARGSLADGTLDPDEVWGSVATGRRAVRGELDRLIEDGRGAYWEVLSLLEEKVERALHRATSTATQDMGPRAERAKALDDISLETLRSTMVYGDDAQDEPSPVQRLVEKCTSPTAFVRVDPERYVLTAVHRDARQEVRKAIGDPRIGSKIRAVAAELGPVGLDELIAAYRAKYPADRLSVNRALAALSLRPHPNASTFPLATDDFGGDDLQAAS